MSQRKVSCMKKIMRNKTWLNILNLISIMSVAILLPNLGNTADRVTGSQFLTRSPVLANNAMAATSQPLATQVALEIMRKGGNAMAVSYTHLTLPTICSV